MQSMMNAEVQKEVKSALRALPAYFGGKRKIIQHIFDDRLPRTGTLVDPMAGSMVIPLAAKALGYGVKANDRSIGSTIIGNALIANDTHAIDLSILGSMIHTINDDMFIADNFGDIHLPIQIARYTDAISQHILTMPSEQQGIYQLLLYRFLMYMAPYNLYRYPGLTRGFLQNTYPASMQKHIDKWNTNIADPLPALRKIATQLNNSIFLGNGEVSRMDMFEFMAEAEGDILYFDPPYAGAGVPYEKGYAVIDQMIARDMSAPNEVSVFNDKTQEYDVLKEVLQYGHQYKYTIFSYWTELHEREWFADMFADLNLHFDEIPLGNYSYSYSTKVGKKGEWSSQKGKGTKEILFLLSPKA